MQENFNIVSHNTMESSFSNFVHLNEKNLFSMGNGEVYGRFVLTFVYLILTLFFDFVFLFPYRKQPLLPHHTRCNLD